MNNPFRGSEFEEPWANGYSFGEAEPAVWHEPPAEYSPEAVEAFRRGEAAAQAWHSDPSPTEPPRLEDREIVDPGPEPGPPPEVVHPLNHSGAQPQPVPATFESAGQPAYRFEFPELPITGLTLHTGTAYIEIKLTYKGTVTVAFRDPPPGLTIDVAGGGFEVEAMHAIGSLTAGITVSGIESGAPSLAASVGTSFLTTEVHLKDANTVVFTGQTSIAYDRHSSHGPVHVEGQPTYELEVKVIPAEPTAIVVDVPSWFQQHAAIVAAVTGGAVALVALALALETGGASLILLAG